MGQHSHPNVRESLTAVLHFLIILVLCCSTWGTAGAVVSDPDASAALSSDGAVVFQQNNTSTPVRHENPDEAAAEDSTAALRQALASRLGQRLEQSSVNLSDGQYEQAQAMLDDDYSDLLSQYAEVSSDGDQAGESSDTVADFQRARERQQGLANDVSEYQRTYQAYREAKSAGNNKRARVLARELLTLQEAVHRNTTALNSTYSELESESGLNTTSQTQRLWSLDQNVTAIREQIQEAEFISTRLSIRAMNRTGSFADPISVRGRLRTANGTPIRSEPINITVGSQVYPVETNSTGVFAVAYRPVTQSVTTDSVTVAYAPTGSSLYLGTNTTVNASVTRPTAAPVRVNTSTPTAGFNDRLTVRGHITVDETPVRGLPLAVRIGSQRIGRVVTGANGSFVFQTRVPVDIADGPRQVSVSTTEADQAVTASGSRTIEIVQRTPTLTAATNPEGNETVVITGQLTGPDGTPLSDQTLSVRVRNETTARIETTADGTYEYSVSREALPANASVVAVQYLPGVSNLAPVTADAALPVQTTGAQAGLLPTVQERPLLVIVLFGTVVSGLTGGVYLYRRRRSSGRSAEERGPTAAQSESETDTPEPEPSRPTLAAARAARDRGELNEAVITAYTAVRTEITAQYSLSPQATHWQFYRAVVDHELPIARDLETLTSHYETAQYAPEPIPSETARELLITAETIHTTLRRERDNTDSEVEQ